jgi:hypothetical protein
VGWLAASAVGVVVRGLTVLGGRGAWQWRRQCTDGAHLEKESGMALALDMVCASSRID